MTGTNSFSRPLRILQVNSTFSGGGTDNQTLELAAGLRLLGDDVILAVPSGSRWEPLARKLDVRVETFPERSVLKFGAIACWARAIRKERIQIIHAHQGRDYWPSVIAAWLAGCGTRVVVSRHLMTRPGRFSCWLLLSFCDVVAVSRAVYQVMQRDLHGPASRLHQVYGGVDTASLQSPRSEAAREFRRRNGWEEHHVVFGLIGGCHFPSGKGHMDLLNAAVSLQQDFPQARYVLVGNGAMRRLLKDRIRSLGWEEIVRLVPFTDDIAPVLNAMDVLVHAPTGAEALGIVLWEAMACGKPVIASRLDGIPEAFRDGEHGCLFPPGDVQALGQAMRMFLNDPGLRSRMGAAGREWVCQNASRETHARTMRQLYCKLVKYVPEIGALPAGRN